MNRILTTASVATILTLSSLSFAVEPCRVYGKIDAGYGMFNSFGTRYTLQDPTATTNQTIRLKETSSKYPRGAVFDLGIGYNLSDFLRTDLSFGYRPYYKTTVDMFNHSTMNNGAYSSNRLQFKQESYNAMANLYYDFNNSSAATPFFLAGIGWERAKAKLNFRTPDQFTRDIQSDMTVAPNATWKNSMSSKNKNNFAFNVGVGLAYKAGEQTYIDLTYKIGNTTANTLGNFAVRDTDTANMGQTVYQNVKINNKAPLYQQSLNLGVRVVF